MYFRYKGLKYFVDVPVQEYKENVKPIYVDNECIKITSWLGTRPQKVELWTSEDKRESIPEGEPAGYASLPCKYSMPGYEASLPIAWRDLVVKLHREKSVKFTAYVSFSRDILAHTDGGFKQELVTKILANDNDWGKVAVTKYKVVGVEVPDQLIVHFSVELRKKF